ncbi:MAG: hypothetical protein OEY43_07440 [Gammaproteobacteria bacterium]|nr:hypothetical protein [Gammaproteobacteria bacterium]
MSKPTDDELKIALQEAIRMKEQNDDPKYVAKALLSHNYRIKYLQQVLQIADRFMNHGMAEHERSQLLRMIEKAKDAESSTAHDEREDFGLE